jgi:ABC-2 type transport system ATP-binding protein
VSWTGQCQVAGVSTVSAADTVLTPAAPYKRIRSQPSSDREGDQMSEATIEVSGLRKRFGPTLALDGMSFTVRPGQVTGFVGPNGAGKSTTMRVILGLDAASAGSALIGGRPYRSLRHPLSHVGALLDAAALQPGRTARNHLLWLAHSQGLSSKRVDRVIGQAGLESAPGGRRAATPWACGSGWVSPRPCSAIRRC